MIVAFTGSEDWTDDGFIRGDVDRWFGEHSFAGRLAVPVTIRVGDEVKGAPHIIRTHFADVDGFALAVYAVDHTRDGEGAKFYRNRRMLEGDSVWDATTGRPADLLIAYPAPGVAVVHKRSVTWNCVTQAWYRRVEVRIPRYQPSEPALREMADPLALSGKAGLS